VGPLLDDERAREGLVARDDLPRGDGLAVVVAELEDDARARAREPGDEGVALGAGELGRVDDREPPVAVAVEVEAREALVGRVAPEDAPEAARAAQPLAGEGARFVPEALAHAVNLKDVGSRP